MIRPMVQILRFYVINKTVGYRSIESLLQNPSYNPLLKNCVDTIKRYPEWAISECNRLRDDIDKRKFKFNSGKWAMDIRDEDIPKGTEIDWLDLRQALTDIKNWVTTNKAAFKKEFSKSY